MIILYILIALIALAALYVFMLRPRPQPKTSVEPLKVDYAHRGLHGDFAVENTMQSFRAADREGYGIELDVRLSADNKVVVFHDDTLQRMCDRTERVDSKTASELSWIDIKGTYERIPLFEDVLAAIDETTPLCIELKGNDTRLCEELAKLLDRYDGYYSVKSFNPFLLNWFRKNRPRYVRGLLVTNMFAKGSRGNIIKRFLATSMLLTFLAQPDYISYDCNHKKLLPLVICKKVWNVLTFTWTVNTPEKYGEAKANGDIVVFEGFEPKRY
jgi:glycerophosphoryl diester phosphodiesterase